MSKSRTAWWPESAFHPDSSIGKRPKYGLSAVGGSLSSSFVLPISSLMSSINKLTIRNISQQHRMPTSLNIKVHHIVDKVYDSRARFGLCYFHDLTEALIVEAERLSFGTLNKDEVEFFKEEIFALKSRHREHTHVDLNGFKKILQNETKLTSADFDEYLYQKMKESEDRRRYKEHLRLTGIFDDHDVSDPFTSLMLMPTPASNHLSSFSSKSIRRTVTANPDLMARVESKMKSPWQDVHQSTIDEEKDEEVEAQDNPFDITTMLAARVEPLTDEESMLVKEALALPHNEDVILEKFNAPITRRLMSSLIDGRWLNDEIVNFSMSMLMERDELLCARNAKRRSSHFYSSFFMNKLMDCGKGEYDYGNVKRWSKKFNVFEKDKIFCPINIGNSHWTLLVIYVQQKRIQYYDSMGNSQAKRYLHGALKYMGDEAVKLNHPFDAAEWTLHLSDAETPQQQNSYDCGAFVVMFADYLSDSLSLEFSQKHLPLFRRKICANILRTKLKYPIY